MTGLAVQPFGFVGVTGLVNRSRLGQVQSKKGWPVGLFLNISRFAEEIFALLKIFKHLAASAAHPFWSCRGDWIRTSGLFVPNEARYRAALHPEAVKLLFFLSDNQ